MSEQRPLTLEEQRAIRAALRQHIRESLTTVGIFDEEDWIVHFVYLAGGVVGDFLNEREIYREQAALEMSNALGMFIAGFNEVPCTCETCVEKRKKEGGNTGNTRLH